MSYSVAVVGASGVVGEELGRVLVDRAFPVGRLELFSSRRSAGKRMRFGDTEQALVELDRRELDRLREFDLVFLCAGASTSRLVRSSLRADSRAADARVVDFSSAFRADPGIPLVIPEVNREDLPLDATWVAVPNCTTILLLLALAPLERAFGLQRVIVSSYQAASGAGRLFMEQLQRDLTSLDPADPGPSPAFNVLPRIGEIDASGVSGEESKVAFETRRILARPDLAITATCVRVPVLRAHSESVLVELKAPAGVPAIRQVLQGAPGVELRDEPETGIFPHPRGVTGQDGIHVGRIRAADQERAFWLFLTGDQLRKGAALNGVQLVEILLGLA